MAIKVWTAGEQLSASDLNNNFTFVSPAALTLHPRTLYPNNGASVSVTMSSNTTGYTGGFTIPASIVLNKISFYIGTVGTAGTFKLGIYSADGQTRYLNDTTASISATGLFTHTLSSALAITGGQFYFVIVPVGTANISFFCYNYLVTVGTAFNPLTGEPKLYGTQTVTAGTLPTTFNTDTGITDTTNGLTPIMRFDN